MQSAGAVVDPAVVQQLSHLLLGLTQPDTNTIRAAENELKVLLKRNTMAALYSLWAIVRDTQAPVAVRHVGAIVLRKKLPPAYSAGMAGAEQQQWQQQVLQLCIEERERAVRAGLIGIAAALANAQGAASPIFLQFLAGAANEHRELCFLLLSEMTDTVGTHWKEHAPSLQQLFSSTLHNANEAAAVQKAAIVALGQLLSFWSEDEEEMELMAPLLPALLQVAARHAASDEDFLSTVLDVLYDLAYSTAPALLPHLGTVVEFALAVLRNADFELRVRDAAALVIATTAEAKPKTVGRNPVLLSSILDTLFQLMQDSSDSAAGALFESNPIWRQDLEHGQGLDEDGDDDYDSPTETSMAQGTLDMLACEIPAKFIWNPVYQRCIHKMQDMNNPASRKAGVAGLGVIAEGCREQLSAVLQETLPHVFRAAQDPSHQVRECACFCLGQMSEHCQPDILQFSSQILPTVFALLDDGSVAVQATSCYVLEMFCERLEPAAVRPLLDPLVRKLAAMLEKTDKRSVQEMAVAALAATAVAAEAEFTPYVPGVATLMMKMMQITAEAQYSLRGRALECMGHMAIAVGRDHFRPYFSATMQCAMEGLTFESTDLQEFAYAVFANLSKVMKEEFAPALADLVPFLIRVIEQDEGQFERSEEDNANSFTGLDDSDDESQNGNYVLHVRTALLEVKKGAITALGEMAAHTGTQFCPFLEQSMQVLQQAASNWHPLIKTEVAEALPSLIVPSVDAYHNGELQWKKGDVAGSVSMSQHTAAIVGAVLTEEIALLQDEDKTVVGKACEAIQSVIELCGPQALSMPVLNECLKHTHELLTKTAPCQTADALYGEVPDDDDDHDVVMQAVCDLVGGYCRVLGLGFREYLPQFLPPIMDFAKSSRPPSDRAMAVGCLSEIAQETKVCVLDHWKSVFLPCITAALADPELDVKRNAAFCAGMCCEHLREHIGNDYPILLQQLGPLFSIPAENNDAAGACVDNAAAAVSRMIMACPAQVPLDQVFPVLLSALPLKTDMSENDTVYNCLMVLIRMNIPQIQANSPEIKRILVAACQEGSLVDEETQNQLKLALNSLNGHPAQ
jgi:importin-4